MTRVILKRSNIETKIFFIILGIFLFLNPSSVSMASDEIAPGTVINAGNIEQYKDYFPYFMQRFITDGWDMAEPVVIKTKKRETTLPAKAFMAATERNKGKTTLNPDMTISGYISGFPFPEPKEPHLAQKVMWNFYYRWEGDDRSLPDPGSVSLNKRKGGRARKGQLEYFMLRFDHRVSLDPKPALQNPHNLYWAQILNVLTQPSKDLMQMIWRYKDPERQDDMWAYVPTLRRTLRMVSSERANPFSGSPATYDDFFGFDGKMTEFDYKLIREQKILALMTQKSIASDYPDGYPHPIHADEPFEMRDVHAIEIKAKDPRYPESRRDIWITGDIYYAPYAQTYDKTGKLWKGIFNGSGIMATATGESGYTMTTTNYIDFKTEYWSSTIAARLEIDAGLSPEGYDPTNFYHADFEFLIN